MNYLRIYPDTTQAYDFHLLRPAIKIMNCINLAGSGSSKKELCILINLRSNLNYRNGEDHTKRIVFSSGSDSIRQVSALVEEVLVFLYGRLQGIINYYLWPATAELISKSQLFRHEFLEPMFCSFIHIFIPKSLTFGDLMRLLRSLPHSYKSDNHVRGNSASLCFLAVA